MPAQSNPPVSDDDQISVKNSYEPGSFSEDEMIEREILAMKLGGNFNKICDGLITGIKEVEVRKRVREAPAAMTILSDIDMDIDRYLDAVLERAYSNIGGEISEIGTAILDYNPDQSGEPFSIGDRVFGQLKLYTSK